MHNRKEVSTFVRFYMYNSIYYTCTVVRLMNINETTARKCALSYGLVMQMRQPYASAVNRTSLQACVRLVYHVWIKLSLSAMFLVWLANSNYVIWVAIIVFRYTDLDLARIWDTPAHRFIFQCRQLFSVAAELNKGVLQYISAGGNNTYFLDMQLVSDA